PYRLRGESNLDQRLEKSRSPNGEWCSTLPGPKTLSPADPCNKVALDAILCRGGARTIHQHSRQKYRERYGGSYARQRRPMLPLRDNLLHWRSGRSICTSKPQYWLTKDVS